jgi:beta-phosphoglucomutase-like phosphatase (HAD superfamily)
VIVRAVVFDFDGVIANSEPLHFLGFRDVLAERGIDLTESEYYARYLGFDDAGAFVAPLAIASGAIRPEIERVLARESLAAFFPVIVAAGDTPASKPAPDPYARAVALLSAAAGVEIPPGDCVAIEDSRWGLDSARAAGLRTVAVTHTYSAESLRADAIVDDLASLDWDLLCRIGQSWDERRV